MPIIAATRRTIRAVYDFAVDGGAVSTITLRGEKIPSGAIIVDALLYVDTALTSGGSATAAIQAESANDIMTATAFGSAPWSSTGAKRVTQTATSAPVVTTAERALKLVVGTAALTAGKFSVLVTIVERQS